MIQQLKSIPWISNLFNLPVTKMDILKRTKVKSKKYSGLCLAIDMSFYDYNFLPQNLNSIFPLFTRESALKFNATNGKSKNDYWWPAGVWDSGRMDFLDWLIESYKYDKTNLRTFKKE